MSDEIKQILEDIKEIYYFKPLLDYITNLQQENERLKRIKNHYLRYRNNDEEQQEVYNILELGKDGKNLHHHKNTGGLNWIDLPMTKFSSISSYIRARDLALEDYKSRCEKADELLELKQLRYLNEPEYRICTLDLQEVRELLQEGKDE